jgi:multidrug efflux pump subunit AcrA (membrane-fusion protein)
MKSFVTMRLVIGSLAAWAGLLAFPAIAADTSSPAAVQVVRARNACFSAAIRITGFLVAREEARVALDAPGLKVTEILVAEGDRVTAGQVLARLTRLAGDLPDAGPGRTPGAPPASAPPARPTTATLKAPAAGTVTRIMGTVGTTASPMQQEPLFRIAVDDEIELEGDVPSVHIPMLASGQTARIEVENSRELSGRVRLVPAAVDRLTQLGHARLSLERDPQLRVGMFARATIDANRSCGISVPRSAVVYRTEGPSVQIVRSNVIETRLVQVGLHSDTEIEIRDGLSEGDLVVANAGSSLRNGDKVTPITAEALMGER